MNVPFFIRHPRRVSKKKNTRRGLIGTRDLESKARAKPECRWSLSSPSKLIMKPLARSKSFLILLLISVRGKRERNKERENVLSSRYCSFSLSLSPPFFPFAVPLWSPSLSPSIGRRWWPREQALGEKDKIIIKPIIKLQYIYIDVYMCGVCV